MRRQFSRATNAMSIFDRDSIFLFLFFMFCNFLAFVVFTHTRASPMNCGWWWERTKLFPCPDTLPCGKPWGWTNVRTKPIGVSIVALLRVLASLTKSPVDFTFLWTAGQSLTHPVSIYLSKAAKEACSWPFFFYAVGLLFSWPSCGFVSWDPGFFPHRVSCCSNKLGSLQVLQLWVSFLHLFGLLDGRRASTVPWPWCYNYYRGSRTKKPQVRCKRSTARKNQVFPSGK